VAAPAVIETIDLTKVYPGGVTAVDGMNLTVAQGEIFGLLGPNGAGQDDDGQHAHHPRHPDVRPGARGRHRRRPPAGRRQAADRRPSADEHARPVADGLGEPLFHGRFFGMGAKASRAAADELLVKFRLTERATAPVMALSGGLAQR
jgi:ABC-2 type transport system ATP-binding protein